MAKKKYYKAIVQGTGLNETLIVTSHEIVPFPASTYHLFEYPNGAKQYKNDFGVSTVTLFPLDLSEEDAIKMMEQLANRL